MQLIRYDAARKALAEARSIDEVKDMRDKHEALAAYARQARDTELIENATELKVRAERRAGEMLRDQREMGGMNKGVPGQLTGERTDTGGRIVRPPVSGVPTLSDMGISKDQSSRWQKLAGMEEDDFETAVSTAKEVAGEVTTAHMLRAPLTLTKPDPMILKIVDPPDAQLYMRMG